MKEKLSFEDARKKVKNKLVDYLDSKGIKSNAKKTHYVCINPHHDDHAPSMHVFRSYNDELMFHCMGCGLNGDIFLAHNILESKPMTGYEFVTENMKPLCDNFNIDVELRPLTLEEIEEMNIKSVYRTVADTVVYNLKFALEAKTVPDAVKKYIDERRLNKATNLLDYSIGFVPSYEDLVNKLVSQGLERSYLEKIDIRSHIFNPNNLIFVIKDEFGAVRGFAARNCNYDPDNNVGSKYINTTNNVVYNKSHLLYNLNRAINRKKGKHSSLYITEGYTDAIALDRAGLKAVAIGSTKFTYEHIALLQRVTETDIVFLLDGDDAGITNTARAITEVMEGIRNFRVRIVTLPDGMDPEEFLRKKDKDALLELPHLSAFEWRLMYLQAKTDMDLYELAEQMIPLVVNEASELVRDKMCKQLSSICGVPLDIIRREVFKLTDETRQKIQAESEAIVDNIVKNLKKNPGDSQLILADGLNAVRNIADKYNKNAFDEAEVLNGLRAYTMKQEATSDEDCLRIFRMPLLEKAWMASTAGKLFLVAGQPNSGKTAFFVSTTINILRAEEGSRYWGQRPDINRRNNVCIIYHTIDDSRDEIFPRFLANLASELYWEATINNMDKPYRYAQWIHDMDKLKRAQEIARDMLTRWISEGRLLIKDAEVGNTLIAGEQMIRTIKQKYPDRHVIYILDNLHNVADLSNIEDDIKRQTEISRIFKQEIIVPNKIMGVASVEYRKESDDGKKSRHALNDMIKGAKSLIYHANWAGHMINELSLDPDSAKLYFWDKNIPIDKQTKQNRSPITRLVVSKNKISDFKGEIYYYLFQNRNLMLEMTKNDIALMPEGEAKNILARTYFSNTENITATSQSSALDLVCSDIFEEEKEYETEELSSVA